MLPTGRGSSDGGVAKLGQVDLEPIIRNATSLFQAWHAFADIQVDPSVGCKLEEVVPGNDFSREYRYFSVIIPPMLRCCCAAAAVTTAIAPAIAPAVTPLLLLEFLTVVSSRGRIRVTFFIGDWQVRVSSSSEGCLTSQKTVKVEAY